MFGHRFVILDSDDYVLKYMESNKTEVALRIFDAEQPLSFPDYIMDAIEWAKGGVDGI